MVEYPVLRMGRNAVLVCPALIVRPAPSFSEPVTATLIEMENGELAVRLFRGGAQGGCAPVVDLDLSWLADALTGR
jgi:hypothetical protein